MTTRRTFLVRGLQSTTLILVPSAFAAPLAAIPPQPYFANVARVVDARRSLGEPLASKDSERLLELSAKPTDAGVSEAEAILASYTLMNVLLNRDGGGRVTAGGARRELVEQGWRSFLVRVQNPVGATAPLQVTSMSSIAEGDLVRLFTLSRVPPLGPGNFDGAADVARRWMGLKAIDAPPFAPNLSGLEVEYRILQVYSRDAGRRTAYLNGGAPKWRTPFTLEKTGLLADFDCLPSHDVRLDIHDSDGDGCMASLIVKDAMDRLYPAPAHRLEPDFQFQPQVYRASGETLRLPEGEYVFIASRGPEYVGQPHSLVIDRSAADLHLDIKLQRWINAPKLGWYPGDTHIHAAGCAHYEVPTQGVTPEAMIRHVRGEALSIGDVLTWGPGYYYQKQFFSGHVYEPHNHLEHSDLQTANNATLQPKATPHDAESLIRYDVEVSGFPSSISGHLVLLRLSQQDYPGASRIEEWPSWNLPILKWAKSQGAVVGYAHCALGMYVDSNELPNYEIPSFDLIGANEFIVDIAHNAVDFVSGTQFSPVAELNFWYHTLNCGFRAAMLGETDFPCVTGAQVGTGRTYVGLEHAPVGDVGFNAWIDGIRAGRLYFGDGRSHFIDYRIEGHDVGGKDVLLQRPGSVAVSARVAVRIDAQPPDAATLAGLTSWHAERARIGNSRNVTVEAVVNGRPVASSTVVADGVLRECVLDVPIERSSWVALRVLPTGHTHPIFIKVGDAPVRASRRSAQWCLDCIDALWREKSPRIAAPEVEDARAGYEHARVVYRKILAESAADETV